MANYAGAEERAYRAYCRALKNSKDNHRYSGPAPVAWEWLQPAERSAWSAAVAHAMTEEGAPPA